jgi:hypothetical protein
MHHHTTPQHPPPLHNTQNEVEYEDAVKVRVWRAWLARAAACLGRVARRWAHGGAGGLRQRKGLGFRV